ncbi:MAG: NADH-ubiquinone oxidoreductase-F iron-sulfur binding region domain-containing protein [Spirochaetaceae bacterium]
MSPVSLEKIKNDYIGVRKEVNRRIIVCAGTGCLANGSLEIMQAFEERQRERGLGVSVRLKAEEEAPDNLVTGSGCQGFCQVGPLVTIEPDGILYAHVSLSDVDEIIEETILGGRPVERLLYREPVSGKTCRGSRDIPFYTQQNRIVLKKCGNCDPEDIHEYIAGGGYEAAERAYTSLSPEEICSQIKSAGLRGRGGGGFPTGKKWELALAQQSDRKIIICNGDEGDPGAFMDRSILEGNPHSVVEGMMIAARATGAREGYIYVRTEYPLAVARIRKAIEEAERVGLLGDRLFGSDTGLKLSVMEGAGAFVCGEASAMVSSIMGNRGMPRPKPPRTAEKGLWDKPTVVNNVETLAAVPLIILDGAQEYRKIGTERSPGTKTFALTGHVANTGLIEVPFGTTLREIIFDIGGGVVDVDGNIDNRAFKAVQIGGPSGGCLTEEHLDVPLEFDSLYEYGAMIGSGGLVVMNTSTCMVQIARFFMEFTQHESCGKCVPCREGNRQMLELLDDIINGEGTEETITLLEDLGRNIAATSLCGLGKSAPSPVLSTIRQFRGEYLSHVLEKSCPTGNCKALTPLAINAELCKGCTLCARKCPVGAIKGDKREAHHIDQELCIKCEACIDVCKFNAIGAAI